MEKKEKTEKKQRGDRDRKGGRQGGVHTRPEKKSVGPFPFCPFPWARSSPFPSIGTIGEIGHHQDH